MFSLCRLCERGQQSDQPPSRDQLSFVVHYESIKEDLIKGFNTDPLFFSLTLVLDLRHTHDRWGSISDPSINGDLH